MPGTPTTPDSLPLILDTDTPDVPRDMNGLAIATQEALNARLNLATGGTITGGSVILPGDPTDPLGAATKQWTEAAITTAAARVRVGHCVMERSPAWAVPSKNAWHQIPFNIIAGGSVHPEWGNIGTGKITVPTAGVYSLQFTGAAQSGTGVVAFNVTAGTYPELFLQEAGHHVDSGQPFYVSSSNLFSLNAGDQVQTKVNAFDHTNSNPIVWGTMIVAKVESY